ncbi:MAG TPA: YggS family pyridoxal phosphate-dependent enzyme [Polyangiaceae bacterium]|nr:YggS family pyridoxal phosphate-dependent enzyme [Polyangiaceae bacterium]
MSEADAIVGSELDALAERLRAVKERIARACEERVGLPHARLLAVSKGQPASLIRAAYALGQRDFGENYVQELAQKAETLRDLPELRLHFIGHLQRNKVKHVVLHAAAVHSVDSLTLVDELERRMQGREVAPGKRAFGDDPRLPILVEVSIAGETQKSGCPPAELGALLAAAERASSLRPIGLMCVPPLTDEPSGSRPYFDALARLRDEHGGRERLPELSMGMTADFEHAIAAGSTLVRVGTAIFGARKPRPPQAG